MRAASAAALACALLAAGPTCAEEARVVFSKRSPYSMVYVVDEGPLRYLRFDDVDGADQSVIDKRDPKAVPMEYVRVAAAGLAFTSGRSRALVVGVGGGAFPMLLRRSVPGMRVDAVDIDPVVVEVAQRYFGVVADERLRLIVADGARYVRQTDERYDLALLDAYFGEGIPAALAGRDFFAAVGRTLREGGVAVLNVALEGDGDDDEEARVIAAFAEVFPGCTMLRGREKWNILVVGGGASIPPAALPSALRRVVKQDGLSFPLHDDVHSVEPCPAPSAKAPAPPSSSTKAPAPRSPSTKAAPRVDAGAPQPAGRTP